MTWPLNTAHSILRLKAETPELPSSLSQPCKLAEVVHISETQSVVSLGTGEFTSLHHLGAGP